MDTNMIHQHLRQQFQGMSFPASKQDLMSWASQHGAGNDQMEVMKKMPMENFNSMDDVMKAADMMMKPS